MPISLRSSKRRMVSSSDDDHVNKSLKNKVNKKVVENKSGDQEKKEKESTRKPPPKRVKKEPTVIHDNHQEVKADSDIQSNETRPSQEVRTTPAKTISSQRVKQEADDLLAKSNVEEKSTMEDVENKENIKVDTVNADNVEDSENDSDSDSDQSEDGGISSFERRRLANIRANAEFLAKINMQEALLDLGGSTHPGARKSQTSKTSNKRIFKKKVIIPRPRSLRIQRKDPAGIQLPEIPQPIEPINEHPRLARGPLSVKDVAEDDADSEAFEQLKSLSEMDIWTCPDQCDDKYEQVTKSLCKLKLRPDKVVKVVRNRVFSMAVHPNPDRLLVVAGDKWGQVGFWDVNATSEDHGVSVYTPHSRPVNALHFSPSHPGKLYSASYDGTVRCCHFESGQFTELYRTSEEYEERLIALDFLSRDQLLVARSDGHVVRVDDREAGYQAEEFEVQQNTVKCVSVHPREQHYTSSSQTTRCVRLFDLRKGGKKLTSLHTMTHGRSTSSAYFSPVTGKHVLTTSLDDTINIYDTSNLNKIAMKHRIRHDNHTGRWLTGFRAVWHPAREDVFVCGSMARPRQIDLYNSSGQRIHEFVNVETLGSVCSINVLHPTIPALIGANSSGKLHAFLR